MSSENQTAEQKIKEAATKVFLTKGFDGATTREIAQEAGMNLALVNYYFRSKEKLFSEIFEEMIHLFMEGMIEVFNRPMGLKEKICALIDHDFEMFKNHPDLVIFVFSEVHRNPERFFKLIQMGIMKQAFEKNSLLDQQFRQAVELGLIRPINPDNAVFLITSSMHMLFTGKELMMQMNGMDENQYEEFARQQKEITKDMILNYLFM